MKKGEWVHFRMRDGCDRGLIGAEVLGYEGGILILETGEAEELRFQEAPTEGSGDWRMLHEQLAGDWTFHETGPIYDII